MTFPLSPISSPSLPSEVGPLKSSLNTALHSGVWGGAPAKIKFGVF